MKKFDTGMYFITDSTGFTEEEFLQRIEAALRGGVTFLQLREKEKSTREYIALTWFAGKRIDNPNTHGTGCTLSSAIASNLAKGFSLTESVQRAKDYISGALAAMLDLGKGSGPMNHAFPLFSE